MERGAAGLQGQCRVERKGVGLVDGAPAVAPIGFEKHVDLRQDELQGRALINEAGQTYEISPWRVDGGHRHHTASGTILSPMPGRIIAVDVAIGDAVTKGQKLVTLEAMKMEHSLTAPFDGIVAELTAVAGAQVQVEAMLVRIEPVAVAATPIIWPVVAGAGFEPATFRL